MIGPPRPAKKVPCSLCARVRKVLPEAARRAIEEFERKRRLSKEKADKT